jgi:phosphatidylinositol alpha 1,6-mannosyltransferase
MRVAYFPDSFHEINGVAHTSRQFQAFASRRGLPFLCVRAANRNPSLVKPSLLRQNQLWTLELPRDPRSFHLDKDLRLDPALLRYLPRIVHAVRDFRADIIHITGPSEIGFIGATVANHLRLPLAASWHTNVHQYAATRAAWLTANMPPALGVGTNRLIESLSLTLFAWFYSHAQVLFAPNPDLCALLESRAHRPCHLMQRGVDTVVFDPTRRTRSPADTALILGYAGRLSIEKNITLLATIHQQLIERGFSNFRFLILGQGAEEAWLRQHLPQADFPGVLRGPALATAYANMDAFVFPSHTDTFGNAVLEALASGVPAVVTPTGGPASIVHDSHTGFIRPDSAFADAILQLASEPTLYDQMRTAARAYALQTSWDSVFDKVYAQYQTVVDEREALPSPQPA